MKNHLPDGKPDCRVSQVSIDSVDFEFAGNIEFQEVELYTSPACREKIYRACTVYFFSASRGCIKFHFLKLNIPSKFEINRINTHLTHPTVRLSVWKMIFHFIFVKKPPGKLHILITKKENLPVSLQVSFPSS